MVNEAVCLIKIQTTRPRTGYGASCARLRAGLMSQTSRAPAWPRHDRLAAATHAIRTVPHETRVIPAGPVHLIDVSPPAGPVVDAPVPEYALNLLLDTAPLLRVGFNRPPRWLAVSPGAMIFAPPDTSCEFIGESSAHVLAVTIPKAHVEAVAQDTGIAHRSARGRGVPRSAARAAARAAVARAVHGHAGPPAARRSGHAGRDRLARDPCRIGLAAVGARRPRAAHPSHAAPPARLRRAQPGRRSRCDA